MHKQTPCVKMLTGLVIQISGLLDVCFYKGDLFVHQLLKQFENTAMS